MRDALATPDALTMVRFAVGQIVDHLKVGYRGVVFGVDEEFSLSEEWYENVALGTEQRQVADRPPAAGPVLRIL